MFSHAVDSASSYQIALADTSTAAVVSDASASHATSTLGASIPKASGWSVASVPGAKGLCFVRRGAGDWNDVITVCDGRVAPLAQVQRPNLQSAAFHPDSAAVGSITHQSIEAAGHAVHSSPLSVAWQRSFSYVLLAIGLGLAMKSGSMLLQGSRKYG